MPIDFAFNGSVSNSSACDKLLAANMDPGALRPWREMGKSWVEVFNPDKRKREVLRTNANATLTKEAWLQMDTAILKAAQQRLRIIADLRGAGLSYSIPNGMGKTVLEYQRMGDLNDAEMSMDGLRLSTNDRLEFDSVFLPLPFIYKDFSFSARQIAVSRDGGAPLDTTMGEACGRKVAEYAEKLVLGRYSAYGYGGGTIYGMTNYDKALSQTFTSPAATAWVATTHIAELLEAKQSLMNNYHYGPFMLYYSPAWDQYLDNDYNSNYGGETLRTRIAKISGFSGLRTLDYLTDYDIVMVEMSSETIRLVIGMDVVTMEWDDLGGLRKNYRVMTIIVPQLRCDMNDRTGILVGTV